jgi:transposase-like protein
MGKKDRGRRVYTKEFKAEAWVEKREKRVSQIAVDLGAGESAPRRWTRRAREAERGGSPPFPGRGRPRDEEPARLRKEAKAPREADEILKKAAVVFAQTAPR